MGAHKSEAGLRAKVLVLEHKYSAYKAAQECGITTRGVTRMDWYQDLQERARKLVVVQGLSAIEAAKRLKVAKSTIERAPWYHEHMQQKGNKNGTT